MADMMDTDDEADNDNDNHDQYKQYIDTKFSKTELSQNLLDFWKQKSSVFPNLAKVAQFLLAIPAATAASEREFSILKKLSQ